MIWNSKLKKHTRKQKNRFQKIEKRILNAKFIFLKICFFIKNFKNFRQNWAEISN